MIPGVVCSLLFAAIIYKWRFFSLPGIPRRWLLAAFAVKLIAGLMLWYVYTHHYSASHASDAHRYYDDAMVINAQWHENREVFWSLMLGNGEDSSTAYQSVYNKLVGWYSGYRYGLTNDCRTIIRIHVVISFLSFGSYHVHWICMAFFAFTGLVALYRAFSEIFVSRKIWLFTACFALPSVVFWSAGLLKEGPTMLGLGLLFWSISLLLSNHKIWYAYPMLILSVLLLVTIKEYVLFSMFPAIAFLLFVKLAGQRRLMLKFICVQLLCFLVAQNAHHFFIGGDFLYVLNKKRVDFENTAMLRGANSVVYVPATADVQSFTLHYPQAFALAYYRPFVWEIRSPFYIAFAVENLCYALLAVLTILFFKPPPAAHRAMLLAALSFVLVLASIIGNTVPVLGSVVRYRIAALPLLVIVCAACIDYDKLRSLRIFLAKRAKPAGEQVAHREQ
ncbi:MAG: hypothetical protein ACKVOR_09135 [Flavobacteriales bacterium]